jgi:hypothetical protein
VTHLTGERIVTDAVDRDCLWSTIAHDELRCARGGFKVVNETVVNPPSLVPVSCVCVCVCVCACVCVYVCMRVGASE